METNSTEETEDVSPINLNEEIQYFLYETAKWAKFLSITGFVFIGLIVLGAFSTSAILSSMSKIDPAYSAMPGGATAIATAYLLMAVLYFFPTFYLYRFSAQAKAGINYGSQAQLTEAFSNLKSVYKFWGILTLTIIIFYLLMLIAVVAGGYSFMSNAKKIVHTKNPFA